MDFVKIQALGNDYVYVDANQVKNCNLSLLAKAVSKRRFSIGADGLIAVEKITDSSFRMAMYNADGSEGEMCGNGVRGATFFAINHLSIKGKKFKVFTKSKEVFVKRNNPSESDNNHLKCEKNKGYFTVDMGVPFSQINPTKIAKELEKVGLYVDKRQVLQVNVGNPHIVFFEPNYTLKAICNALKKSCLFPFGVNVERVFKIENLDNNNSSLFIEIDERGSGKTLSCGSGAVAVAYAFSVYSLRPLDGNLKISVISEGGCLKVNFEGGKGYLSGEVEEVFKGAFDHTPYLENEHEIQ